jgi:plasmid stabilization system protein ParE
MRVRYTLQAQFDLDDIYTHLDRSSPATAQSVKNLIERRIAGLADFPFMAPETDVSGIYQLTIVQYPYKVYYEVEGTEVWILHIRDSRRRPWKPTRDRPN